MKNTRLKDIILNDNNIRGFNTRLLMGTTFWGIFGTIPLMFMFESRFQDSSFLPIITIVGPLLVMTGFGLVLYTISMLPARIMNNLWETGIKLDGLKIHEESVISNFEEVYHHTKKLYVINKRLTMYKRVFGFMLTNKTLLALNEFFIESSSKSISLLSNLRSDLSIRLAEQQSLLESAKGEVEKNINGTTELESVSELQKQRLDKQIEQFEELQRVLVKV